MKKGFSLLEIAVAAVIIVIVGGLALYYLPQAIERARWAEARQVLIILWTAQRKRQILNMGLCESEYPFDCLDVSITPPKYFNYYIQRDESRLARAVRNSGNLRGAQMWIDMQGNFHYDIVPSWLQD